MALSPLQRILPIGLLKMPAVQLPRVSPSLSNPIRPVPDRWPREESSDAA
jgi:hypothetical protein